MAVYNFLLVVYINKNGNHETSSIQLHCFILGWDKTKENSLDTMWWDVNLPVPPLVSCGWLCAPGKRVVWTKSQNCWPPNHHSSQPACDTTRMKQVSNQWYIWERDRERDSYKYGDSKFFMWTLQSLWIQIKMQNSISSIDTVFIFFLVLLSWIPK